MVVDRDMDCFQWNVKLIVNSQMARELDKMIDYARFCWNELLELKQKHEKEKDYNYNLLEEYRPIRNASDWQLKLPQYILNQVHRRLIKTSIRIVKYNKNVKEYNKMHSKKKRYQIMQFKTKTHSNQSFTVDNCTVSAYSFQPKGKNFTFGIDLSKLSEVPKKYRMMEIAELPPGILPNYKYMLDSYTYNNLTSVLKPDTRVVNVTIFKRNGEFYASFCLERLHPDRLLPKGKNPETIGIDPGISSVMTLSTGRKYHLPKKIKQLQRKAQYYRARMRKRKNRDSDKQSKGYYKARAKFEATNRKIANLKLDWMHKITSQIARRYQDVHWENCEPSKMKRMKTWLVRYISEASWGELKTMLSYKLQKRGCHLVSISSLNASTQRCSACGTKLDDDHKLKLYDRVFKCPNPSCNHVEDRDINAAKNIAKFNE